MEEQIVGIQWLFVNCPLDRPGCVLVAESGGESSFRYGVWVSDQGLEKGAVRRPHTKGSGRPPSPGLMPLGRMADRSVCPEVTAVVRSTPLVTARPFFPPVCLSHLKMTGVWSGMSQGHLGAEPPSPESLLCQEVSLASHRSPLGACRDLGTCYVWRCPAVPGCSSLGRLRHQSVVLPDSRWFWLWPFRGCTVLWMLQRLT